MHTKGMISLCLVAALFFHGYSEGEEATALPEKLIEDVNRASEPKWSIEKALPYLCFGSHWSVYMFADAFSENALEKKYELELAPGLPEGAKDLEQPTPNFPILPTLAVLQSIVARHGMLVRKDPARNKVVLEQIDAAWGDRQKLWEKYQAGIRLEADKQTDLGKLGYMLASLLAFEKKGIDELHRLAEFHKRPEVRFLSLSVLVNSQEPVDIRKLGTLMADDDESVAYMAVFLLFTNSDQKFFAEVIESLVHHTPLSGQWKPRIAKAIEDCLDPKRGPQFRESNLPTLKSIRETFKDSESMRKKIDKCIQILERANKP